MQWNHVIPQWMAEAFSGKEEYVNLNDMLKLAEINDIGQNVYTQIMADCGHQMFDIVPVGGILQFLVIAGCTEPSWNDFCAGAVNFCVVSYIEEHVMQDHDWDEAKSEFYLMLDTAGEELKELQKAFV